MKNPLQRIRKWRSDFGLAGFTRPIPALKMFLEETTETIQAGLSQDHTELRDGLVDTLFVLVQLAEAHNIDLESDLDIVLTSNYTKMCNEEEMQAWLMIDPSINSRQIGDNFFGFKNGKLQKPPQYQPPQWDLN